MITIKNNQKAINYIRLNQYNQTAREEGKLLSKLYTKKGWPKQNVDKQKYDAILVTSRLEVNFEKHTDIQH